MIYNGNIFREEEKSVMEKVDFLVDIYATENLLCPFVDFICKSVFCEIDSQAECAFLYYQFLRRCLYERIIF